ncbi:MAG TPA: MotA/TolQ/ExbB proton channel family protein [Fibrobacteraceae bacterium]|nr:MotA/TolQ/ExbB proton channel family protein [Fibrobacteraceae bacterium]
MWEAAWEIVLKGGWIMGPIFLAGWWAWLLLLDRAWILWRATMRTKTFWNALQQGGLPAAEKWLSKAHGIFVQMSKAALKVRSNGSNAMQREVELLATDTTYRLRRGMRTINRLAALAPLLGLLGTVSGIVHTFGVIMRFGFGNPTLFASGISEALVATQSGLLVAIPIAICYNWVLRRAERLEVQAQAEALRFVAWVESIPSSGNRS